MRSSQQHCRITCAQNHTPSTNSGTGDYVIPDTRSKSKAMDPQGAYGAYGAAPAVGYGSGLDASPYGAMGAGQLGMGNEISTLWIGNVLPGTTDYAVAVAMFWYGQLTSCFLLKNVSPQGQMSGFVKYSSHMEAQNALNAIKNGQVIVNGQALTGKLASKNSSDIKNHDLAAQQQQMLQRAYAEAYQGQSAGDPSAYYDAAVAAQLGFNSVLGGGGACGGALTAGYDAGAAAAGMQQNWQAQGQMMGQDQLALGGGGMLPANHQPQYIPPRFPEEEITTLWIGNMLPGTTDYMLAVQLSRFGEMGSCFLMKSLSPNGQMSGFARFNDRITAQSALDAILAGQVIVGGSPISGKFASRNSSELKDDALKQKTREMLSMAMQEALGLAPPGAAPADLMGATAPAAAA
eukprot:TRINITY_DN80807_c0_g1_i1.p1 TRINITY_DN80807_c0_g1~~TRINITY_DN80807_c0_g1_i1.p1  ORF type:complete len:412 (-),score=88.16 TRINITY_DN80807_c0_g1_i1:22-1236(-)